MFGMRSQNKSKDDGENFFCSIEQSAFFCVPESTENIPKDKVPIDGFEYIRLVKQEREECPEVSTCDVNVPEKKEIAVGKWYIPSNENRKIMINVFFKARYHVKSKLLKQKYSLKNGEHLPSKKNMLGWTAFCLGKESMCQLQNDKNTQYLNFKESEYNFDPDGYEPYCRFICSMDKASQLKLLSFTDIWLKHFGFSRRLGLWIHSLLLVIERPLINNEGNVLSYLAGTCLSIRENVRDADDELSLLIIICAIKTYFECVPKKKNINVKVNKDIKRSTNVLESAESMELDSETESSSASSSENSEEEDNHYY